ncbi:MULTISPECIES: hypothetical protein [Streptomyces]|uniref:Uncharacterized protein n=1 Tax=Streptomyces griseus TaxID=1911 RepID=A0A380P6E3_STRGR|nr:MULTISPECIES: hypothetical protein [Streptomyces]NEE45145.1 hypothetical protein [Streptomyces sp. SID8455]RPK88614.1 hypothetical protein EES47_13850 [Streptomyces sp. ADI98-12]SUP60783.1 Uncharacterised protein [Streptomyces griseus]
MSDFEQWMAAVTASPGPGEDRLDLLRDGEGIEGLDDNEQAAWLLRVMVDYTREPQGWHARVLVGRAGPECAGPATGFGRFNDTLVAVMDQAQAHADATRRPVKVIHGVNGKPDRFLPTLAKHVPDLGDDVDTPVWVAFPAPLTVPATP